MALGSVGGAAFKIEGLRFRVGELFGDLAQGLGCSIHGFMAWVLTGFRVQG